jgi:diguanylate cyclase (GGDEF)-like protein
MRGVAAAERAKPFLAERIRPLLPELTAILGLIGMIWVSTFVILQREYAHEMAEARGTTLALSKAYSETSERIASEIDQILLALQSSFSRDQTNFDLDQWAKTHVRGDEMRVQLAIHDKNGFVTNSTIRKVVPGSINVSDRPHFLYHLDPSRDDLYVSDPVIGRTTGKQTIQFTRKLLDSDGHFNGMVLLSLSCSELSQFYATNDVYKGSVGLISPRGVVLAGGGLFAPQIGKRADIPNVAVSDRSDEASPHFVSWGTTKGLLVARPLKHFPLTVAMFSGENEIFARYFATFRHVILVSSMASFMVVLLGAFWLSQRFRVIASSHALTATLAGIDQGILMIDSHDHLSVSNKQALDLLRLPDGQSASATALRAIDRILSSGVAVATHCDHRVVETIMEDGQVLEVRTIPLANGEIIHTLTDITERHVAEERIRYLAHHDVLTGLPNRTQLDQKLSTALERARREGSRVLVAFVDLDGFKGVNDTLGHLLGDSLLVHVAKVISSTVGPDDFVARMGGDEFVIIRTRVDSADDGSDLARTLIERVVDAVKIDGHELRISASIGIAAYPDTGIDGGTLFKNADIALYRAKNEGRSTWRVFEPWMDEKLQRRVMLEEDLRRELDAGSMQVHYQPQFNGTTLELVGFEALVRWEHPKQGFIYPEMFIAVAEECGLINKLGAFVLEKACSDAVRWPSNAYVAVNVSVLQLLDTRFADTVKDILRRTGLPPHRLELEVTESVMAGKSAQILNSMRALHQLGVGLALDDFGTGYSSLGNLLRFQFDKVKIDKSFVQRQDEDPGARAILEAILAMGRHIGLQVVAEGAETEDQLAMLRRQGCPIIQGYILGRPLPGNKVHTLMDGTSTRHGEHEYAAV